MLIGLSGRLQVGLFLVVGLMGRAGLAQDSSAAQEPAVPTAQQPGAYTLKVKSQMVVLDVVVNTKKGEVVPNLTKDDFKVFEDKVPQTIVSFETSSPKSAAGGGGVPEIHSTAELDRKAPQAPVSIIVLDEVTTKFEDEAFARYSLKKYLSGQSDMLSQPTLLMAVGYKGSVVLHDYTTSKKEVLDALARHFATYNWQAQSGGWKSEQFDAAFAALMGVAEATAGHPGHKNVVWVGRGFPSISVNQMTEDNAAKLSKVIADCTNLLRDSRVTLYSIDPVGLSVEPPATDEDGFYEDDPFGGNVNFDTMARATGGQAFHGRNDVDNLIGTSVRDGETFYTIAYRPTGGSDGAATSDKEKPFRNITVKMNKPELVATTRQGYYDAEAAPEPAVDAKGKVSNRARFDLGVAMRNLMVYDGLPMQVERDAATPDKFTLKVKASSLEWTPNADGKTQRSKVSVVTLSFDRKGKLLNQRAVGDVVELPIVSAEEMQKGFVRVTTTIATAAPAARVRFVVRADSSGKVAADNFYLVDAKTLADPATGLKAEKVKK